MGDLFGTVVTAIGVFAGTNVDDIVVLTVLFLSARAAGRPRPWQIWVGQYAGIAVLVAVSAVTALGLTIVPDEWVGLLGLVPLALGVKGLVGAVRAGGDDEPPPVAGGPTPAVAAEPVSVTGPMMAAGPMTVAGPISVAGVTIANGGDNISVYTPLFRTIGVAGSVVTVVVFAVLVAVWCEAGSWLGSHRRVIAVVRRFGHWIVPAVFLVIGAVIIVESGVLGRLAGS